MLVCIGNSDLSVANRVSITSRSSRFMRWTASKKSLLEFSLLVVESAFLDELLVFDVFGICTFRVPVFCGFDVFCFFLTVPLMWM